MMKWYLVLILVLAATTKVESKHNKRYDEYDDISEDLDNISYVFESTEEINDEPNQFTSGSIEEDDYQERARPLPCVPGDIWKEGCKECYCLAATVVVCTNTTCSGDPSVKPTTGPPGTVTFCGRKCSTKEDLVCGSDGVTYRNKCLFDAYFSCNLPDTRCVPLSFYHKDCNGCFCPTNGGPPGCTRMACPHRDPPQPDHRCTRNAAWMKDCNECSCVRGGFPKCSRRKCVRVSPLRIIHKGTCNRKCHAWVTKWGGRPPTGNGHTDCE